MIIIIIIIIIIVIIIISEIVVNECNWIISMKCLWYCQCSSDMYQVSFWAYTCKLLQGLDNRLGWQNYRCSFITLDWSHVLNGKYFEKIYLRK